MTYGGLKGIKAAENQAYKCSFMEQSSTPCLDADPNIFYAPNQRLRRLGKDYADVEVA